MTNNLPHLAKPSGVLLEDHVRNLLEQAEQLLAARAFVCRKYRARTGDDLGELLRESARWHDEGKKHPKWQKACRLDHEEYQRAKERNPKAKVNGRHLRKAGIRHEMASLEFMRVKNINAALPVRAAIAAHHSKLGHRHRERWNDEACFEKFWKEFVREGSAFRITERDGVEKALEQRYKFSGVRALLQLIDHRASASEEGEALPEFKAFAYEFPYKDENGKESKRGVQREIEKLWDEPFSILRAPTGAGKTDAALLWAKHQIEDRKLADRLVIAMPTRFTANALSISAAKDLSAVGLYHSSAWYQRIKGKLDVLLHQQRLIDKEQVLARKLETPVTVTTIDHLCICLTGTREDHHATFFNLAHSCVVIDEADFYDDFTQQNIVTLLRALRALDVPVLLMSATVPESAKAVYENSGFAISKIHEDTSDDERVRCVVKKYGKAERPDGIADLLQRALDGEPTIIYANTVRRAQEYYRWFKQQNFKDKDMVLYHSRFTEPHKAQKEEKLRGMLGSEAWQGKNNKKPYGVAILTQIGEISVNISADFMISDMCPLDRLAQRAGRLARFAERVDGKTNVKGELFIIEPQTTKKDGTQVLYPAPYGTYDNGKREWLPAEAFNKSITLLSEGNYSAKTFVDLVNKLYPSAQEIASHIRINQRAFEDCVVLNWLILPAEQNEKIEGINPDDDHTLFWKSRDIPEQYTIYVIQDSVESGEFDQYFSNKSKLREFQLRHGLQCPIYEFSRAVTSNVLEPMTFYISEEDTEQLYVIRSEFYNAEIGLHFDEAATDNDDEENHVAQTSPGII